MYFSQRGRNLSVLCGMTLLGRVWWWPVVQCIHCWLFLSLGFVVRMQWSRWWMGADAASWRWQSVRMWSAKYSRCWCGWTKHSASGNTRHVFVNLIPDMKTFKIKFRRVSLGRLKVSRNNTSGNLFKLCVCLCLRSTVLRATNSHHGTDHRQIKSLTSPSRPDAYCLRLLGMRRGHKRFHLGRPKLAGSRVCGVDK